MAASKPQGSATGRTADAASRAAAAARMKGIDRLQENLRGFEFVSLKSGALGGSSAAASLLDAMNNAQKRLKADAAEAADALDLAWEVDYAEATGDGSRLRALRERRTEGDEPEPSD